MQLPYLCCIAVGLGGSIILRHAKLIADRLHLLAQEILALMAVDILLDLFIQLALELQHGVFPRDDGQKTLQLFERVVAFQYLLLIRIAED